MVLTQNIASDGGGGWSLDKPGVGRWTSSVTGLGGGVQFTGLTGKIFTSLVRLPLNFIDPYVPVTFLKHLSGMDTCIPSGGRIDPRGQRWREDRGPPSQCPALLCRVDEPLQKTFAFFIVSFHLIKNTQKIDASLKVQMGVGVPVSPVFDEANHQQEGYVNNNV